MLDQLSKPDKLFNLYLLYEDFSFTHVYIVITVRLCSLGGGGGGLALFWKVEEEEMGQLCGLFVLFLSVSAIHK